jgi:hypothetical protein
MQLNGLTFSGWGKLELQGDHSTRRHSVGVQWFHFKNFYEKKEEIAKRLNEFYE